MKVIIDSSNVMRNAWASLVQVEASYLKLENCIHEQWVEIAREEMQYERSDRQ